MTGRSVEPDQALIEAAIEAQTHSYCKYSKFAVGCAMRTDAGVVFQGCNIESLSFGLSNCAERVTIGVVVSSGTDPALVTEVLVVGPDLLDCSPCGACRQVLHELVPQATIWFRNDGGWAATTAADMLPHAFEASLD